MKQVKKVPSDYVEYNQQTTTEDDESQQLVENLTLFNQNQISSKIKDIKR